MKKTMTLVSLLILSLAAGAQGLASLHENFDVACASSSFPFTDGWTSANFPSSTAPEGAWTCTPTRGRNGTPGMLATGVWSGAYHIDTSYLITPKLDFAGLTPPVYINYDLKIDSLSLGGQLFVVKLGLLDTTISFAARIELTDSPSVTVTDSLNWVTHQVDLSAYANPDSLGFYMAFMYVSSTTAGSMMFIDNINTTNLSYHLSTPALKEQPLRLTVTGQSTPDKISVAYNTVPGTCKLSLYNILGQVEATEFIDADGAGAYQLTGLNLAPGMYFIRLENDYSVAVVKTIVQ